MSSVVKNGIAAVCREYQEQFCATMSRGAFADIKSFSEKGIEPELMMLAIEKAVQKGAKWSYAKAILDRCIEEGILKKETFEYRADLKKVMKDFKKEFPYCDESLLLLFSIIEISREYLKEIEAGIAAEAASKSPFNINDYMDED